MMLSDVGRCLTPEFVILETSPLEYLDAVASKKTTGICHTGSMKEVSFLWRSTSINVVIILSYFCSNRITFSMLFFCSYEVEHIVQQITSRVNVFDKASLRTTSKIDSNKAPRYQPLSCNPNLRLYKYTKGQWFGKHVDGSNKIDFNSFHDDGNAPFPAGEVNEAQTEMTVLFYLSSCRGGATRFHLPHGNNYSGGNKRKKGNGSYGSIAFVPEEGAVLLHLHGDHCLEHEAEPVLEGVKYGKNSFADLGNIFS